jgi:membrane-bound lytic murein transglycosylase D
MGPDLVTTLAESLKATAGDPATTLAEARLRHERAWSLRDAGELTAARAEAAACLDLLAPVEVSALEAAQYRQLSELRSRASGLLAALDAQIQAAAQTPASKDEVLDAPAVEDIQVQLNSDVYRWIDYFTGAGRSVFERWLRRSGRYMDMFRAILEREGLPTDLVHLVFVESGFNLHARSVSSAVGPWQFVRSTARLFGLTVNQWVDERKDPEKSTVAAARYLKHLYTIFNDWPLALASYNAGEGAVLRAVKRQGTTDYWKLRLPRQTEDYVPQFMAVLAIARQPERYGFDGVELDAPMDFDEVTLVGPVDLRAIAKLAGCNLEELRQLNPAVLRHTATGRFGATTLRVPRGTGETILYKLQSGEASLPAVRLALNHRVHRGETLTRIAQQYGVSAQALAKANHISKRHPLRRGMVLNVPSSLLVVRAQPVPPEFVGPLPPASVVPTRPDLPVPELVVTHVDRPDDGPPGQRPAYHSVRVRRGETLGSIARREGVTVSDLKRWNGLRRTSVRAGQRLRVYDERPAVSPAAPPAPNAATDSAAALEPQPRSVVVQPGDTLSQLARRHGTTVGALMKANGITSPRSIRVGMRLWLPGA